jgi:hypothetical protein
VDLLRESAAAAGRLPAAHERRENEFLFALEKAPGWGMDVSPDEREILIPQHGFDDADLVMAEGLP